MVQPSLNVAYSDGSSQVLWEGGERVFSRGWRLDDNGNRIAVLLVAPAAFGIQVIDGPAISGMSPSAPFAYRAQAPEFPNVPSPECIQG